MRRSPLKRSGPIGRRKPLKPINRARKARRNAEAFGEQAALCRTLACCVPACNESTEEKPSHPHHVRPRGAGGKDKHCVNICWLHHREVHAVGQSVFLERHGVDLVEEAGQLALQVEARRRAP